MDPDFHTFEVRIDSVYRSRPGAARQQVLLTRLYCHVFKVLDQSINRFLAESGLNGSTWLALMLAYSSPDHVVHPTEISEIAASSRTNATRVAGDLERRGWITREPSDADRRRVELRLTPAGVAVVERLLPVHRRKLAAVWSGLSDAEQATLERVLRKLLHTLPGAGDAAEADEARAGE